MDCGIDPESDINNCGACHKACAQGEGVLDSKCTQGSCVVTCDAGYLLCDGSCVQTDDCSKVGPYSDAEIEVILGLFLKNIDVNGGGAVMASPSTQNPNYYYHWMRDAAISMNVLLSQSNSSFDTQMQHYVTWVHATQTKQDTQCDVRAEPKFEIATGEPYAGGWMRPQSDGPALRTITLVNYAFVKIRSGDKAYAQSLWPSMQLDMQYVIDNWNQPSGDPWEEVKGNIFFTMFCQRKALLWAAQLATVLGDSASAAKYQSTAKGMEPTLEAHWNAQTGIIMELEGTRPLDSAVHLGLLYGNTFDGFLSLSDPRSQSSVSALLQAFSNGYYHINDVDDAAGVPGLLVGRYPQDTYMNGCPWILTTNALAEVYYWNAFELQASGHVNMSHTNRLFFQQALDLADRREAFLYAPFPPKAAESAARDKLRALVSGQESKGQGQGQGQGQEATLSQAEQPELFAALIHSLVSSGDGFLLRVKEHIKNNGLHMQEQIGRDDGSVVSAVDLTWSYGTALAAMQTRARVLGL